MHRIRELRLPDRAVRASRDQLQLANRFFELESGDRATFDMVRTGDAYTISSGGFEFLRGNVQAWGT